MIEHLFVGGVETGPVQQQVGMELDVVGPLLVLKKLLSHEEHRNARRCQADRRRDTGAAAAVPRAWIARIPESRDAILTIDIDDVVVFRALDELPVFGKSVGPEAAPETRHVKRAF